MERDQATQVQEVSDSARVRLRLHHVLRLPGPMIREQRRGRDQEQHKAADMEPQSLHTHTEITGLHT